MLVVLAEISEILFCLNLDMVDLIGKNVLKDGWAGFVIRWAVVLFHSRMLICRLITSSRVAV